MGDSDEELDRLSEQLRATVREFDQVLDGWNSIGVSIPFGPRRLRSFPMSAGTLSWIINLGNLGCFALGLAFALLGGTISTVGTALLVGSLFSEGAFIGQLWVAAFQSGYTIYDRLWGDEVHAHLKQLQERITDLSKRIDELRQESEGADAERFPGITGDERINACVNNFGGRLARSSGNSSCSTQNSLPHGSLSTQKSNPRSCW